jgi:hypothetical protein
LGFAAEAVAQGAPAAAANRDRVVYEAAFYDAFAPRTALDMINQTPGFTLIGGGNDDEEERRGFSGAVGNVLIDGRRLGAKSQSLGDVLGRVGAKEVLRIEVLRGAAVAGDASGATVIANVVRTATAGGGTWEAGFELANQDKPMPNGSFGWSGRKEALEYSVGGKMYSHDHRNAGHMRITDGAGELIATRSEDIPHSHGDYALNGQLAIPVTEGRLTFTGQVSYFDGEERFQMRTFDPSGDLLEFENIPLNETNEGLEAGATWERALGSWEMNVTALATRKHDRWDVTSTLFDGDDVQIIEYFQDVDRRHGESILRGTVAKNLSAGRVEYGAEAAINTLDGKQQLTGDQGDGPQPLELPNANLRVKETRGEAFVSHAWRISNRWSLDSRLAVETSRLSFTGDTEQSVSLAYVKPRLQLTRQLGAHQLQLRVFRDVGQLDFNDFVSTAAFADGIVEGGNPDLRPQTAWATEVEADFRFPRETALRLKLFKHFVHDVVDLIPIGVPGEQFDAPGNIGEGSIVGAEVTLRVPLDPLITGGTLSASGVWQESEVTDPTTGAGRPFSSFGENSLSSEFRQDLKAARFAWGMNVSAKSSNAEYRLAEVDRFDEFNMFNLFAESTWFGSFKIRVEAQALLAGAEDRDRAIYLPDRNGPLAERITGKYRPGRWWLLSVSSTF